MCTATGPCNVTRTYILQTLHFRKLYHEAKNCSNQLLMFVREVLTDSADISEVVISSSAYIIHVFGHT